MNVNEINTALARGEIDVPGLFPHLEELRGGRFVLDVDFGLGELPEEPGVILIRGARQYGKSTWLEGRMRETVERHGPGSAFYLNGDEMRSPDDLARAAGDLARSFASRAGVRRLFIDEITAVRGWEKGLKRTLDAGDLKRVLVVTTGSSAADLRRGSERLPGRKGRLARTTYLFTPVSFPEFRRVCGRALGKATLPAYLLAGGCPAACREIAEHGHLPEWITGMIRDWMLGECAASGRNRSSFLAVVDHLIRHGGAPLGQAKLARETGLANNTVAAGYVELLADLTCVGISHAWDETRNVLVRRRPAKYHFLNLLAAASWHPSRPRSPSDLGGLPADDLGRWWEWAVAQELWRRAARRGDETPEISAHWQGAGREIDFALGGNVFVEVKHGRTSPTEYAWFPKVFPKGRLVVVGRDTWEAGPVRGTTLERFLLDEENGR